MIIDVAYIRQALVIPETTPNSSIEYLIKHYYDYIVEMMNLVTTMEKEEISNTIIEQDITEEELIINNKLTLFQQTLILGIACSLINMQIAIKDITNNEYEYFIQNIDWMQLLRCFVVGGIICIIGQILIDKTKLTPARILVTFVTAGAILRWIRNI